RMVAAALDPACYEVTAIDTRDLPSLGAAPPRTPLPDAGARETASTLIEGGASPHHPITPLPHHCPDVVFIALHGKGGEDGTVQGMLEVMGIPYTGSGVLASALAMDKVMSKRVFKSAGIPVIDGIYVPRSAMEHCTVEEFRASLDGAEARLGYPMFVKPNAGGSTCGCTLVERPEELFPAVREALRHDEIALVERYVRGAEITIGVLDCPPGPAMALPVIEIVPKAEYYDFESKYAEGGSEHIIPARLPQALLERAQQIALDCHAVLGCRGVSRTDIIAAGDELFVLEVNTIPGMTPTSLLPQAAEHAGISFPELLDRLIRSAICDTQDQ
ncbi:MAG TPA: D-alanine--D-alanine ligase, partial [Chthonomonadaceae bacterium]|nr:D-alanine--D-alanine ligase [Chthonomonadaceae bacterium]